MNVSTVAMAELHAEWHRTVIPLTSACKHCEHGRDGLLGRVCDHPDARGMSAQKARSLVGPCGPEASLLKFKS
jgi:hypothetical protein